MYDVYYTTGGGPWVNAGTDLWVNDFLENVVPHLKVKPVLLIHRTKPKGFEDFEFPIETHWQGDNVGEFEKICNEARRINILHGHYTPMKAIVNNKDKIHSNVLHNSVDHILKSQVGSDAGIGWHPWLDSKWEKDVNEWATHSIWIGLFDILIKNKVINNYYEFKHNLPLSKSNTIGFASRCEGRKNPHYLENLDCFIFTNSFEFNLFWKNGVGLNYDKAKIYHYYGNFKDKFYDMDWGISHSAFTSEPFGYGIFEAVDRGKLPILHSTWCKGFEYPYRVSSKKEFIDIYNKVCNDTYETKNYWFKKIKNYMIDNYSNKQLWIDSLLDIYNI